MPRTVPDTDAHQDRLLSRADASADAAERAVRAVWLDVLRAIERGGPWPAVYAACRHALHALPRVADAVAQDLAHLHRDAATWTAEKLAATLPRYARLHLLRRRGVIQDQPGFISDRAAFIRNGLPLFEDAAASETDLLTAVLLPPIDAAAVQRVVFASGWSQTIARLTTLAAPDALASRIASLVQQGLSIQQIAREVKPVVEGVQASARRVARTAGLWVAHEAELETYRGLEGDLIRGYTVRAVLDARTRPEHRRRDGSQFWCRPEPGQKGLAEMPRPPREADGSWAFNCRCWLEPILALG